MSPATGNITSPSTNQSEEEDCGFAYMLAAGAAVHMVLKAVIELDLLELIKKTGPNAASATELAAQLPTNNPDAANTIDRLLRLLSSHDILTCTMKTLPDGFSERRYSLKPAVNKFMTKNEDGVSLAPLCLMMQDKVLMESWYHLKDVVLEGGVAFNRGHGMGVFEVAAKDPRFNQVFNRAFYEQSTIFLKKILEVYKGFEGLESLVDVGGNIGGTLHMIQSMHPSIRGINFDLPHVVKKAPSYPGVEHIGGDMFVSVPSAEAILLKLICHDWNDTYCIKLLKNCYEALPKNGKVIIIDKLFPADLNNDKDNQQVAIFDVVMLAHNSGGKERTEMEFQALATGAGFKKFIKVCVAYNAWIMELYK